MPDLAGIAPTPRNTRISTPVNTPAVKVLCGSSIDEFRKEIRLFTRQDDPSLVAQQIGSQAPANDSARERLWRALSYASPKAAKDSVVARVLAVC